MLNACVKTVYSWCSKFGKTCVHLFTGLRATKPVRKNRWVKLASLPQTVHGFVTHFSTVYFAKLPLAEHYFYPLSTGPITIFTN